MNHRSLLMLITVLLVTAGCGTGDSALTSQQVDAWRAQLLAGRQEKDRSFATDPTSPMAGIQRLELQGAGPHYLIAGDDGLRILDTEEEGSLVILRDGTGSWSWWMALEEADRRLLAEQSRRTLYRFTVKCYPMDNGILIQVFDPERTVLNSFTGLQYYDPDPGFAVNARVERFTEPVDVPMGTSQNLKKIYKRVARLHFSINREPHTLAAYKMSLDGPYSDMYFVPFRDLTSGTETYGAGRFLELKEPAGDQMLLDFNRAFNPLCNYSSVYNCPLPPTENHLLVPVKAGERTYPHASSH